MIPFVLILILGQSLPATSQTDSTSSAPVASVTRAMPFGAGERMEYVAKLGFTHVGSGSMEIVGIEDVRGRQAVHTNFRLKGRALFFSANYVLESWVDQADLQLAAFHPGQRR